MDPSDWDAQPPSIPPSRTTPRKEDKGKGRAEDDSSGMCLPQELPGWFGQRTQDYPPTRPFNAERIPESIETCHGHYQDVLSHGGIAAPDRFYDLQYSGTESRRVDDSSSSNGAGPSNQHAPTVSSGIANLLALHSHGHNGKLWRTESNRKTPKERMRHVPARVSSQLDSVVVSPGDQSMDFTPNPESNYHNNIGKGFQPHQRADNAGDAVNPLVHDFYRLQPLRNLTMARPAKEGLPPIRGVLGDILQSGSVTTNSNIANNNGGINPYGIGVAACGHPDWRKLRENLKDVSVNNTAHERTGYPVAGRYPTVTETERFRNRGYSNGYDSFGDYMSVDMPSADLGHFSIMNQHHIRTQREPNTSSTGGEQSGFNIFQEMLKSPDLILTLARHLRIQELDILFSICKPFHQIVKESLTSVMVEQSRVRAPEGRQLFPWRCYSSLCIDDPKGRLHDLPEEAAKGVIRKVPTLRWLKMLCFREMVVHEIMTILHEDGVGVPDQCETAIKKIWFLMDVPDNRRRNALVQSRDIVTDEDLFYMIFFFVKLDLRFTDPINGGGQDGMRRMLLAQPTLSVLWRVLKRTALVSKIDVLEMFVRWKGQLSAAQVQSGQPVFGVPPNEVGMTQYEYWGLRGKGEKLEQIEELLILESIRRELNLDQYYPDMFLWGYVNPSTRENLPPVVRKRRLERLEELEEVLITRADREKGEVPKKVSKQVIVLE